MLVTLVATITGWSWEAPREPPKGPRRPRSWYDEEPPEVDDDAPVGDDDTATNESADGTQVPDVQGGNSPLDGLHCYLAESKVAEVLRTKTFPRKGTVVHSKAELGWGDCGPGRDHTLEQRQQYEALIDAYEDIFLTEAFPKACKAAPIVIPLIDDDAKLPFEKAQSGGMQHQAYLSEVRDQLLSFGILGDPDHPEGASRMTLAAKGPDDIRACMDLRRTNPLLRTFAYHYTSRPVELGGNPTPKSVSETRHAIGVFGVARRFVDNFATIWNPCYAWSARTSCGGGARPRLLRSRTPATSW
jgi:hypothetical protein